MNLIELIPSIGISVMGIGLFCAVLVSVLCFGGGGGYTPTPPPDVPTEDSPEIKRAAEEAAKKERELARKRKGRRSTRLTGGSGVLGDPITRYGQLLGTKTKLGQ